QLSKNLDINVVLGQTLRVHRQANSTEHSGGFCILLLARRSRRDVRLIVTGKDAFPCSPYGISRHKLKHLDADLGHTTIGNPQAARGAERQVENAVASPWSAVGDHNYYRSVGRKISHANSRAERQAAVRCSWQIPIER